VGSRECVLAPFHPAVSITEIYKGDMESVKEIIHKLSWERRKNGNKRITTFIIDAEGVSKPK